MVLVVGYAHHGGHGDREVPVVAVGPHRGALCVGGGGVCELEGRERGGVHDVAFGVVGVGSDVPASGWSVPLDLVPSIDLKDIGATTGFGHGGVHGHAVDATDAGLLFIEEDGVPCLSWVGGGVMGVFFVPYGHGYAITGSVREREQEGLTRLKPDRIPVVLVVPHVNGASHHITGVNLLSRGVCVVGLNLVDDFNARCSGKPRC